MSRPSPCIGRGWPEGPGEGRRSPARQSSGQLFRLWRGLQTLPREQAAAIEQRPPDAAAIAAGGQRFHQEPVAALVQRVERQQLLGFALGGVGVAAQQLGLNRVFERMQPDGMQQATRAVDPGALLARQKGTCAARARSKSTMLSGGRRSS